jgi:hypothetical protein
LLGILEQFDVTEITSRSGGEFRQRSASAADSHTNALVLENTHHGASEDAEQKGLAFISRWLYAPLTIKPK